MRIPNFELLEKIIKSVINKICYTSISYNFRSRVGCINILYKDDNDVLRLSIYEIAEEPTIFITKFDEIYRKYLINIDERKCINTKPLN